MIKIDYGVGQEILLENIREMEEPLASLYSQAVYLKWDDRQW